MLSRASLDRFVGWFCRELLALFFRRVEVVGRERLPEKGPYVVVANHVNGLIDPMFVFGSLAIPARTLAKSTLWKIPGTRRLLDLAGAIPVYRRIDDGFDSSKNSETFSRCHEVLRDGGRIALFPEGISHDEPRLQPLRTGVARIVLEAERKFGPLGAVIVPVGLLFDERGTFRTRVLVVIGEPIEPSVELATIRESSESEPTAVRALTARVAKAIEALTANYGSWEEARLVELGADVYERMRRTPEGEEPWKAELAFRRTFAAALPRLREERPAELARAIEAADEYERLLGATTLTDAQVAERIPLGIALKLAARSVARLVVYSPLALIGSALNFVPFALVHLVASLVRSQPNQIATYQLFPSLVLYPAAWIGEGIFVGSRFGPWWGVLTAIVAPATGWIALLWHEQRRRLWRETRAFLLLRRQRAIAAELHSLRRRVEGAIEELASYVRSTAAPGTPASASRSDSESSRA